MRMWPCEFGPKPQTMDQLMRCSLIKQECRAADHNVSTCSVNTIRSCSDHCGKICLALTPLATHTQGTGDWLTFYYIVVCSTRIQSSFTWPQSLVVCETMHNTARHRAMFSMVQSPCRRSVVHASFCVRLYPPPLPLNMCLLRRLDSNSLIALFYLHHAWIIKLLIPHFSAFSGTAFWFLLSAQNSRHFLINTFHS